MIEKINIENYKSLQSLEMELGRVNVLIGANGCGKTNILEAVAMGEAALLGKEGRELLVPRGVRWTEPSAMKSGFSADSKTEDIVITLERTRGYASKIQFDTDKNKLILKGIHIKKEKEAWTTLFSTSEGDIKFNPTMLNTLGLFLYVRDKHQNNKNQFLIYCPENTALRNFESEGQIEPLGIKGEGLFKHLAYLSKEKPELFDIVRQQLQLIDWYDDFEIPNDLQFTEKRLNIKDRFLEDGLKNFDQRSANEGFLYLLFYLVLFVSPETPDFFAIDNVDNALNPKLCSKLISVLAGLAKDHDKQVIFTAHNPAILDGLDLGDDQQRLFVIARNAYGHTKAHRIIKKASPEGEEPLPMSERFLRGYIGGLPKNF